MSIFPELYLHPKKEHRLKQGHLWIYSNEVDIARSPMNGFQAGQIVTVINHQGKAMGLATINPNNLICARILSRKTDQKINTKFFAKQIKQAQILRKQCYSAPYYRLVFGDADFLPGIIVDQFGEYLVLQITTAGMEACKQDIIEALQKVIQPKGILVANDHSARQLENLENYQETIGSLPNQWHTFENDVKFIIPGQTGQKTGWFYDHRENRRQVNQLAQGKSILDVFSYVGGWGLQAGQHGAKSVTCVDISEKALDYAETNAQLLNLSEQFTAYQGKAHDVLKHLNEEKQKFDIVVVDPPAFIKRKKDINAGLRAYKQINDLAIRLVSDGGTLVSASCSMHLEDSKLQEIVQQCSAKNDRHTQLFYRGCQGLDHPIHPAIRETNYIKAQFYRVLQR